MKILVYTGYNDTPKYKEMGDYSSFNKLQYCQAHGYDFLCERDYSKFNRHISWYKIDKMIKLIDDYDWIFWSDADSIIINRDIKLTDIIRSKGKESTTLRINDSNIRTPLPDNEDPLFICSDDVLGPCMANFFVKNSPKLKTFLRKIYARTEYLDSPWWDQMAAHAILHEEPEWRNIVKILPKEKLHRAFDDYQPGDFIIHDKFNLENGKVVPK